jgi:hypothetical protein
MTTGMSGTGSFLENSLGRRTRDWSRPEQTQPIRKLTPEEQRQMDWQRSCEAEQTKLQAARATTLERQRQEQERQHAEAARQQARAAHEFLEAQIDTMFANHGLTPGEIKQATERMIDSGDYTVERANFEGAKIAALKQETAATRITAVRADAFDDEWAVLMDVLRSGRHSFAQEQLASGEAHERLMKLIRERD